MPSEIHQNDIGTEFQVTILDNDDNALDISDATALAIVLKGPDGTSSSKTATFVNTGTDGLITYTAVSGDLGLIGTWKIQGIVTVGTNIWYSNIESFKVHRNL